MVVGFSWGGWVSASASQKAAETMAKDAVVERLAPICVAQFNQDPDNATKLNELTEMTSYQRAQYVQDQGWATISGDEKPDRKVADACTRLLLEMSP
jgi:pimeloyl-ACP methyl ester carboxylesterase